MKFKKYLTENDDSEVITIIDKLKIIQQECQPFLNGCGDNILYRGINNATVSIKWGNSSVRQYPILTNRRPLDSLPHSHDLMNYFFEIFHSVKGWRNISIFCKKSSAGLSSYGPVSMIYPVGDFHIAWADNVGDSAGKVELRQFFRQAFGSFLLSIGFYFGDFSDNHANKNHDGDVKKLIYLIIDYFNDWKNNDATIEFIINNNIKSPYKIIDYLIEEVHRIVKVFPDESLQHQIEKILKNTTFEWWEQATDWIKFMTVDKIDKLSACSPSTEITIWGSPSYYAISFNTLKYSEIELLASTYFNGDATAVTAKSLHHLLTSEKL